jgi:hypothetical protein
VDVGGEAFTVAVVGVPRRRAVASCAPNLCRRLAPARSRMIDFVPEGRRCGLDPGRAVRGAIQAGPVWFKARPKRTHI